VPSRPREAIVGHVPIERAHMRGVRRKPEALLVLLSWRRPCFAAPASKCPRKKNIRSRAGPAPQAVHGVADWCSAEASVGATEEKSPASRRSLGPPKRNLAPFGVSGVVALSRERREA
jgi:hypothetical protein